jgi:hypothetical protein
MFAHRFAFPETEKCFRNAIFTHSVRNARNVQYSPLRSEASVCERSRRVDVRPPFCFPRNREMLQNRDDDQLSKIFTPNAGNARIVQYSLVSSEASVCERCSRVDVRPPLCFPRNREMLQKRNIHSQCSLCTECSISLLSSEASVSPSRCSPTVLFSQKPRNASDPR